MKKQFKWKKRNGNWNKKYDGFKMKCNFISIDTFPICISIYKVIYLGNLTCRICIWEQYIIQSENFNYLKHDFRFLLPNKNNVV